MVKRFVSIGECMVEMSGGEDRHYRLGFAGDTFNTAWYVRALLGADWQVDYVTALGEDRYSEEMASFMAGAGIGTAHIQRVPNKRPGLYMIHQAGGDRHFTYWRETSAARLLADDRAALDAALAGATWVYFSGITLAILNPRARGRLMRAIVSARDAGAQIAFDPNVRPALWTSQRVMRSVLTAGASIADLVLPTHSDEAPVFGDQSPEDTAARYLELGATEVAVKDGPEPAVIAADGKMNRVAPPPVTSIVDTTGAGDSFNAGYISSRAEGLDPRSAAERAHRLAGQVVGHRGALVEKSLLATG